MIRTSGAGLLMIVAAALLTLPATARAQGAFPYDQEMLLDVKPMPGGKRVPVLDVMPDGTAHIDLWCKSGPGLVTVVGDTVVITFNPMPEVPCTPQRTQADEQTAAALSQVTQWHMEGDILVLSGPTELRFRASSH